MLNIFNLKNDTISNKDLNTPKEDETENNYYFSFTKNQELKFNFTNLQQEFSEIKIKSKKIMKIIIIILPFLKMKEKK